MNQTGIMFPRRWLKAGFVTVASLLSRHPGRQLIFVFPLMLITVHGPHLLGTLLLVPLVEGGDTNGTHCTIVWS